MVSHLAIIYSLAVYPIYEPTVISKNDTQVFLRKNSGGSFVLVCETRGGYDTELYWELPNTANRVQVVFEEEDNSSYFHDRNVSVEVFGISINDTVNYTRTYYTELEVHIEEAGAGLGVYKCVVRYRTVTGWEEMEIPTNVTLHEETVPTRAGYTPSTSSTHVITSSSTSSISAMYLSSVTVLPTSSSESQTRIGFSPTSLVTSLLLVVLLILIVVASIGVIMFIKYRSSGGNKPFSRQSSYLFRSKSSSTSHRGSLDTVNTLFFMDNKEIPRDRIEFVNKIGMNLWSR